MVEDNKNKDINQEEQKGSETKEPDPAETAQEEKPLEKMTSTELKDIAREIPGVTGVTAMKKDELVALIKEYRGIEDEEPAKKKKKGSKKGISIKELKQQIGHLKSEKNTVQGEKDRQRSRTLRRRINRLKKRTRKVVQA